jgi:hypothetical protein
MNTFLAGSCIAIASVRQFVLVPNEEKQLGRPIPGKNEPDDSLPRDSKKMMEQNDLLGEWDASTKTRWFITHGNLFHRSRAERRKPERTV